ncbi:PDDEXK nuclease domain-containing protein [Larkinella sp.]|uniref:PDDEXK nuclease domain-containing protein n=1 Tax=Larkinella sp. TaxID=2034517 RepID=UPI003BAB2C30
MDKELLPEDNQLVSDIKQLIEGTRQMVSQTVNSGLTQLYWHIGKRINTELLAHARAEYGKQIVVSIAQELTGEYGRSFDEKNLRRMIQFSELFPDADIVATLSRQLSWSHFVAMIPLKDSLQRDFYAQMCRIENWSVRTLRQKIDGMLFERTALSKKPEDLAQLELRQLREEDRITPDLIFKDPYLLDFLNLKDTFSELDLEEAILREIEKFILELGNGFTFVERQKRMVIDNQDFRLDLLFYHRRLKRLVAVELKLGKFKAAYKGQMELYLRWLEKYDQQPGEEQPIGLILCAEGNREQIELLQLDTANIRVAEYLTDYLPKELLMQKLHQFTESSKRMLDNRPQPDTHD